MGCCRDVRTSPWGDPRGMEQPTDPLAITLVADGETTGGTYALIDVTVPAGTALDAHVVNRETMDLWVLRGVLQVVVDGLSQELTEGDHLRLPPRVARALRAISAARVLALLVPAGAERLAVMAADSSWSVDDRAAWLAASDVRLLPGFGKPRFL